MNGKEQVNRRKTTSTSCPKKRPKDKIVVEEKSTGRAYNAHERDKMKQSDGRSNQSGQERPKSTKKKEEEDASERREKIKREKLLKKEVKSVERLVKAKLDNYVNREVRENHFHAKEYDSTTARMYIYHLEARSKKNTQENNTSDKKKTKKSKDSSTKKRDKRAIKAGVEMTSRRMTPLRYAKHLGADINEVLQSHSVDDLAVIHQYRPHSTTPHNIETGYVQNYSGHVGAALHASKYITYYQEQGLADGNPTTSQRLKKLPQQKDTEHTKKQTKQPKNKQNDKTTQHGNDRQQDNRSDRSQSDTDDTGNYQRSWRERGIQVEENEDQRTHSTRTSIDDTCSITSDRSSRCERTLTSSDSDSSSDDTVSNSHISSRSSRNGGRRSSSSSSHKSYCDSHIGRSRGDSSSSDSEQSVTSSNQGEKQRSGSRLSQHSQAMSTSSDRYPDNHSNGSCRSGSSKGSTSHSRHSKDTSEKDHITEDSTGVTHSGTYRDHSSSSSSDEKTSDESPDRSNETKKYDLPEVIPPSIESSDVESVRSFNQSSGRHSRLTPEQVRKNITYISSSSTSSLLPDQADDVPLDKKQCHNDQPEEDRANSRKSSVQSSKLEYSPNSEPTLSQLNSHKSLESLHLSKSSESLHSIRSTNSQKKTHTNGSVTSRSNLSINKECYSDKSNNEKMVDYASVISMQSR